MITIIIISMILIIPSRINYHKFQNKETESTKEEFK
jgi:hypothetical protein